MNCLFLKFELLFVVRLILVLLLGTISIASLSQSRQASLTEIDQNYRLQKKDADTRILKYLKKNPQARIMSNQNGRVQLLVDISEYGTPVYVKTFNDQVAASLNVKQLRTGGSLGINILGTGIRIGTWESGKVRNDHVELVGRVTQMDGAITLDDHATHTSGTMIASGINSLAKGMAPDATVSAFDFNNDVSEMTTQAKPDQTSLLLSNHSYGTEAGWDCSSSPCVWRGEPGIDAKEDYKFGFYDTQSSQWDGIAVNAPYYLIVKAAGNDRNEYNGSGPQPPDGPYDCIPTFGVAKNILTVGAVNKLFSPYTGPSDVLMTQFSSWGPTDDGRIKPDIVAPGLNVLSSVATSTTDYKTESGTSMSTPAVTGTLALLQQLYKNLNSGKYMRSATLKALALHTAREAGAYPGPDYSFGWGLLDAEVAAKVIINKDNQNIFIQEAILTNGQAYELNLTPKAGFKITATLVWTDPAATPPPPSLNPTTKMLVNDLDLRLVDNGGTQQFPWLLNPATDLTRAAAATKGDNLRDNVEKIEFSNPDPRSYKIRVTNKGTLLGGTQPFSLIVTYTSVVDPRVTYYWIGTNGGAWDNAANWSLTSGGSTANIVPAANDRVVFDEKSFTAASTINFNANQSCYSVRWFGNQYAVSFSLSGYSLSIGESMTLLTNKITTSTTGIINFSSTTTTTNAVDLNANVLDKWSLVFNGTSAWGVTGSASVDKITIAQGTVAFNSTALHLNQLISSGVSAKTVSFTTASLQALQSLWIDFTGVTVQSDNSSSIIIMPSITNTVNLSSANFQGIVNVQSGDVLITGTGQARSIQGNGIVRLNGSLLVSNLSLSGGSQLILQQGATQTFTDKIVFSTSPSIRVAVKSSGSGKAVFAFNDYYKICLDNIDVTNVDITGTSIVNAGVGSTVINSLNWLQANCSSILFPDFSVSNTCIKSSIYFSDKSSGTITSRLWTFDDPTSTQNTSTLASPLHYYSTAGPFVATLTLNGTGGSRSTSKTITLQPNDLADNTIQLNNGNLISTVVAQGYQWLKDGQIVSEATSRSFNFAGAPGEYAVLIFNSNCNKRSDPFLVTAIEDNQTTTRTHVKTYPNPTSDFLQIESGNAVLAASILDAVGREWRLELERIDDTRYRVNVSTIPSGLYILKTTSREKVDLQKIIIRK